MTDGLIYLDNQSTTRVDPRVVEAMLPFWTEHYGNAGSTSHAFGWRAKEAVDESRAAIAELIGAKSNQILFTSGATESNNLAIRGAVMRRQSAGKHVISVQTEHRAVLDPLKRLSREGFEVTYLSVHPLATDAATIKPTRQTGQLELDQLRDAMRPETALVSVMLANNEIGVIQPLAEIAEICHEHRALLHCDATQAVGKIPFDVRQLNADLVSFSAHKLYGPKGIGALYVARRSPQIRLVPLIEGGGQERGMRSGTLPVPLIVGFAEAMRLCWDQMDEEIGRLHQLRGRLFLGLQEQIEGCWLNGPEWDDTDIHASAEKVRLPHNLNMRFDGVEGESLMLSAADLAVSSGSACTSAHPEPSHVLRGIGLNDDQVRSSLRFGLGRFNTEADIDRAIDSLDDAVRRLRSLSSN